MSPAKLLHKRKHTYPDGTVVEMTIWQLPKPTTERPHGLKYSLHCGYADGTLIVRYDNEQGKGDHRHFRGTEEPYHFVDIDTLISDFIRDIQEGKREKR
ncbi:DUF6516 family protein [Geobacter sp.]|uniref:toxin-antitoxin system TumE family protein n=1 Tax=Geobacter sp. TaxID=46610 RepID=UPI0027BAA447|nr:DUF6516 family protein [Geobacter sp.]